MLDEIWAWFAAAPTRYWVLAAPFGVALLTVGLRRRRLPAWLFFTVAAAAFAAFRWPVPFYPDQLNNDEAQMLAAAQTWMASPGLWGSVDSHAAGPVSIYPITLLGWLGLPPDYLTARLFAYAMDLLSVAGLYFLLREVYGERLARAAALLPIAYFCLNRFWDLTHFTSETVPATLFSLGFAGLWIGLRRGVPGFVIAGAIALGAIPWAKLQAGPIALIGAGGALVHAWLQWQGEPDRRRRLLLLAVGGGALPTALFAAALTISGIWGDWWNSYLTAGVSYAASSVRSPVQVLLFFLFSGETGYWAFALPLLAIGAAILGACLFHATRERLLPATLGLCVLASFWVIVAPARPYPHYLLLTIVPLVAFTASLIGTLHQPGVVPDRLSSRPWMPGTTLGIFVLLTVGTQVYLAASGIQTPYDFSPAANRPVTAPAAEIIKSLARPGDSMAMWGWEPRLYVQTGLPQGTREAHTERQLVPGPQQEFYQKRFLADLTRNRPRFFVDATSPELFFFTDRRTMAHEAWPELHGFINAHYRFLTERGGFRIFVRADGPS